MKKISSIVVLFVAVAGLMTGCATNHDKLTGLPSTADPRTVGLRVADNLLGRNFMTGKKGAIHYAEVCTGFGALRFADVTGDATLEKKLIVRYSPVLQAENVRLIPPSGHVDNNVFGSLPLEIFLLNGDTKFLALGLDKADEQWESPLTNGLTRETRWWVDDAWMIGSLQIQAYRATHDMKYVDRITAELAAYLDRLQEPNGLFHHGPEAPFYWARGNGWVAASLAEVLRSVPPEHPRFARLMAGYKKMMAGLKAVQGSDGLWHQLLDDPQSWTESSGSAMFTYAMIVGVKHGWLDAAEYGGAARRGWIAVCGRLDEKANLREICVGTGQSKDKQYYLNRPRQVGDCHGQAPVLWCAWALLEK